MKAAIALAVAALVVGGCSALSGASTGRDLTGHITVADLGVRAIGDPCSGRRPFLDVRPDAVVTVRDGDGDVLGEGRIGDSEAVNAHPDLDHLDRTLTYCRLTFTVADVAEADTYELEFGDGRTSELEPPDPDADEWFVEIVIPQ